MEYLEKISGGKGISFYKIKEEGKEEGRGDLKRFVFSTPETREVCNKPEIVGLELRKKLKEGMVKALKYSPERDFLEGVGRKGGEGRHNILTVMRGGLNFDLSRVLGEVLDINCPNQSFMTSERFLEKGEWLTREKQYCKLTILPGSVIYIGDIIATGTTLETVLAKIAEQTSGLGKELPEWIKESLCKGLEGELRSDLRKRLEEKGNKEKVQLRKIILFTIGGKRGEEILGEYGRFFREVFEGYEGSSVYYIEGRFGVAEEESKLTIKLPGTDLLRHPALLSPKFELSQYERAEYCLERCVVYDGGSRLCDYEENFKEVIGYWRCLEELGREGKTTQIVKGKEVQVGEGRRITWEEMRKERWPEEEYRKGWEGFKEAKEKVWKGIREEFLKRLYETYERRWKERFLKEAQEEGSLERLARRRIERLEGRQRD